MNNPGAIVPTSRDITFPSIDISCSNMMNNDLNDKINNKNASVEPKLQVPVIDDYLEVLIDEMRMKDFDSIRFATYRTACKLRFVQKKTNANLVDIWNMIESFRENGLNALLPNAHFKVSRLELLLTSVFHNLNKRLPATQHIDTDYSIAILLSFLLGVYDKQDKPNACRLTVFSVKIGLATLCTGKLVDKLRYVFSLISDSTGNMEYERFVEYLQQVLALPSAVFETPTFGFSETALAQCFKREEHITLNNFLDALMSDTCPPCLLWLQLLHRMASVEHVYHPVVCDACQIRSFTGFRYKCQRCANYQLCQSCFWRGRTSLSHSNEHEMKEYSSYKSPTKQLAHSIQKSLQCMPSKNIKPHKIYSSKPQKPLNLANIVPITPAAHRQRQPLDPLVDWTSTLIPGQYGNENAMDDEHKLIARYAAKLAGRTNFPAKTLSHNNNLENLSTDVNEQALIARLEEENNDMLREMALLEQQQTLNDTNASNGQLHSLRERTADLEARMREKQQLRHHLMQQLLYLMTQLKSNSNNLATAMRGSPVTVTSLLSTADGLNNVGGMITTAFKQYQEGFISSNQLQGDLLQAAGAITTNMKNLVLKLDQVTCDEDDSLKPLNDNYVPNELFVEQKNI